MENSEARDDRDQMPENDNHNMEALLAQQGDIDFPRQGEIRTGVIASIGQNQILVSVGTKSEGIISGRELEQISKEDLESFEVGQSIPVFVLNPEDHNGNVVLSFNRAREETDWLDAEALLKSKASYHSQIIGYNKGGLIVRFGGLRGFVPASQVSLSRRAAQTGDTPDKRWSDMVNEEVDVCVIEVDREKRRLILSERAASTETREMVKDRLLDDLKEGDVRTGRVTSLAEFGAFVNINGADGLVHLSEISWDRIQNPAEVLKVGQEVKVKVINIDREKKRIGLSIRQLKDDPWMNMVKDYQVGQLVEGVITRLAKFGAFARLSDEIEGLIHISEISEKRIEHPREVLKEGESVTLRIIKIDPDNHRIGLSMRKVESMAYADMDWQTLLDEMESEDQEDSGSPEEDNNPEESSTNPEG
ncbi:MAG TPA: S1 RNA-binding domain-containing protein [Anaerolineaceae bacterium]|nr:S1 RNA-binding domain-containing protein [Anaerolineaceae bacterium]HPC05218.1 S1 RNA-binding domain-containing protein [Anaerolineaceae bacterium]HQN05451.1 S1 RNA-binding domain-containing protein [Anaerolineaceae bacterium]HQP08483.1 S1 RNA-binding domain-containing protein [Anaerolineaceae bacterium]